MSLQCAYGVPCAYSVVTVCLLICSNGLLRSFYAVIGGVTHNRSCSRYCQAGAHSLLFDMLVVAVWRHPAAISIAWSGLQLVAQGGMPRDLDSLVAEVKTLLCLLVALHCFQALLERLSRHWWMHAHVWSMGEGVGRAIGCFECRLTRRLT